MYFMQYSLLDSRTEENRRNCGNRKMILLGVQRPNMQTVQYIVDGAVQRISK